MTILISAAPGSASNTLKKTLEKYYNTKSKVLACDQGIGHLNLRINARDIILKKLKIYNLINKDKILYGHVFPTTFNLDLLNKYFFIDQIIVTYRNIFDQLNYIYKWKKLRKRTPLGFANYNGNVTDTDIDLDIILMLNFYKQWFIYSKRKKVQFLSYKEITNDRSEILFNKKYIKIKKSNVFKKVNFKIKKKHYQIVKNFLKENSKIDFSLITN